MKKIKLNSIRQYGAVFWVLVAVLALFVASPLLQRVLVYPQTEFFTELWILGPEHKAENYPTNISVNQESNIFLGVTNRLGSFENYRVEVKFRNQTQSAPDSFNRTFSELIPLYKLSLFVADGESLELPISFAFDYVIANETRVIYQNVSGSEGAETNGTIQEPVEYQTLVANFISLNFNGLELDMQGYSSDYDSEIGGFYGNLIFELWIYNSNDGSFQYHERFVDLKFKMQ